MRISLYSMQYNALSLLCDLGISQDGQNGKNSKCWQLTWKSQSLT